MQLGDLRVNVSRVELLEKLKENLKKHKADCEKAIVGWKDLLHDKAIELIPMLVSEVIDCPKITKILSEIADHRNPPPSYANYYERAIAMLEMAKDETIELGQYDFDCYVRDEWEWKMQWAVSNTRYFQTDVKPV